MNGRGRRWRRLSHGGRGVRVGGIAGAVVRAHAIGVARTRAEAGIRVSHDAAPHLSNLREIGAAGILAALDAEAGFVAGVVIPVQGDLTGRRGRRNQIARRVRDGSTTAAAGGQLEGANARAPGGAAGRGRVVLAGKPERAVVDWIDTEHAVITPAAAAVGLRSRAENQIALSLS